MRENTLNHQTEEKAMASGSVGMRRKASAVVPIYRERGMEIMGKV